jgi:hypothetical protein
MSPTTIIKILIGILILFELILGYQLIANLFYKNEWKYIEYLPFDYCMVALAATGLVQFIIISIYLLLNRNLLLSSKKYFIIFIFVFMLLLLGINSYLIYYCTDIITYKPLSVDLQNKILNDIKIKILIPIDILVFIIISIVPIFLL